MQTQDRSARKQRKRMAHQFYCDDKYDVWVANRLTKCVGYIDTYECRYTVHWYMLLLYEHLFILFYILSITRCQNMIHVCLASLIPRKSAYSMVVQRMYSQKGRCESNWPLICAFFFFGSFWILDSLLWRVACRTKTFFQSLHPVCQAVHLVRDVADLAWRTPRPTGSPARWLPWSVSHF